MEVLFALAGAAVAFAAGVALGRIRRPDAPPTPAPKVAPATPSFADLVEVHPAGVVVAAADGSIAFRNAAARALQGTHVGVLVDEALERHIARARFGEASHEVLELYGPPKQVLALDARPVTGGAVVAFVEDVSERRHIDQVRTDFVANISHELKTPVGAMAVLAEALEGETDPQVIARLTSRLTAEAERAARTVDDLMELSRIELGGERSFESVAVADVVTGAIERVTEVAAQRGIAISALGAVEEGDALLVTGDRRQLVSALRNLVENAVKYSEPGSAVHVRIRRDGDTVELAVADAGVGIPQRDLDRIFERFYRVDRGRSRATGGTGLGLSIVRHVATNHGGDVRVESSEGEGSTFRLRLPLRRISAAGPGTAREEIA